MEQLDQIFVILKRSLMNWADVFLPDWSMTFLSILISIGAIAAFGPVTMMYLTLLERKLVGRIQNRYGPNRVGFWGLLQPIADGIKMLTKEDIVPDKADRFAHFLAPIAIVIPALLIFSVVPFGRGMTAVDLSIGLLFFLALSSTTTIWILLGAVIVINRSAEGPLCYRGLSGRVSRLLHTVISRMCHPGRSARHTSRRVRPTN